MTDSVFEQREKRRMGKNFIKDAIKRPGAMTKKSNAAGESNAEFAGKHEHDSGLTGKQARFYENVLKPANEKRHPLRKRYGQ